MERLDDSGSLGQLSLHRDDEVQAPKVYARSRDLADDMASHLGSGVDVETRKRPLPGAPTIGVSSHQLIISRLHV